MADDVKIDLSTLAGLSTKTEQIERVMKDHKVSRLDATIHLEQALYQARIAALREQQKKVNGALAAEIVTLLEKRDARAFEELRDQAQRVLDAKTKARSEKAKRARAKAPAETRPQAPPPAPMQHQGQHHG